MKRDKVNLDIFWLKDESLEDSDNLPAPEVIAAEIVENLQAALDQFAAIAADLADRDGINIDGAERDEPTVSQDVGAADPA